MENSPNFYKQYEQKKLKCFLNKIYIRRVAKFLSGIIQIIKYANTSVMDKHWTST